MISINCHGCPSEQQCRLAGRQICPLELNKYKYQQPQKGSDDTAVVTIDSTSYEQPTESTIKDSGERTKFSTGAVRDMHTGKGRFDLLPMCVLLRLAQHYEKGALKYAERNWEKGIPAHSFADSAMRHIVKYMDGYTDEDHLIAAIWNLCGLAWTEEKHPELMDIPSRSFTPTTSPTIALLQEEGASNG